MSDLFWLTDAQMGKRCKCPPIWGIFQLAYYLYIGATRQYKGRLRVVIRNHPAWAAV